MKKTDAILTLLFLSSLFLTNLAIAAEKTDAQNASLNVNSALEKEIQVPDSLQLIIKVLFGIERTISISLLILVLTIWLFSFLFFANVLKLTPFFKGWTIWPAAAGVTILIALSGVIKNISLFLLNAGDSFAFLAKLGAGALLLIIVIIIVIAVFSLKVLNALRKKIEKEQAQEEGSRIGTTIGMVEKMKEMFGFTRKA